MLRLTYRRQTVSIPYRQAQNVYSDVQVNRVLLCFNSLQVGSKPLLAQLYQTRYPSFQFLIGRLKTWNYRRQEFESKPVSIPYRQAQNLKKKNRKRNAIYQFQFLIGRLKTFRSRTLNGSSGKPDRVSIPYRQAQNAILRSSEISQASSFNSLQVGSKRGTENQNRSKEKGGFQFLIGRLKTRPLFRTREEDGGVSIPYRQAQNPVRAIPVGACMACFNSLQVGSKPPIATLFEDVVLWFQFLIGRLKTRYSLEIGSSFQNTVSIPYRQAQNQSEIQSGHMSMWFQFLIGRLKTSSYHLTI